MYVRQVLVTVTIATLLLPTESNGMAGVVKTIRSLLGYTEMAPYDVISEREGIEERLYYPKKWVTTSMEGSDRYDLLSPMFRKLFNYISGRNQQNMRIDMTTPVTTYVQPSNDNETMTNYTMAFFVPEEHQSSPPTPGTDVFLEDRPQLTVLTRRFGGYATDDVVAAEVEELTTKIKALGETDVDFDHYYVVGYDPPFKPFGRRNEVWFIKTTPPGSTDLPAPVQNDNEQEPEDVEMVDNDL